MKNFLYLIYSLFLSLLLSTFSYGQTVTTITYKNSGLANTCNVFNLTTPPTIGGLQHLPEAGGVGFDGTSIDLGCSGGTTLSTNKGTAFLIRYDFLLGTSYSVNMVLSRVVTDPRSYPQISTGFFINLPDPNKTNPTACGPVPQDNWSYAANFSQSMGSKLIGSGVTSCSFSGITPFNVYYKYLSIVVTQSVSDVTTGSDIKIASIKIVQNVPFSLTPNKFDESCGTPITQTFTANISNPLITSFTWDLGPPPNGWKLSSGLDAPNFVNTPTNTITLNSPNCPKLASTVGVQANFADFSNAASNNSNGNPLALAISGPTKFCTSTAVYSVPNCPSATVVWSASPAGLVNLSCTNCASTTLTKVNPGNIVLKATITNSCIADQAPLVLGVTVGAPHSNITYYQQGPCSGSTQPWFVSMPPNEGTGFHWTPGFLGTGSSMYIVNPFSNATSVNVVGGGAINVNYTDLCGAATQASVTLYSFCHGTHAFSVSPNPSSGIVSINSVENPTSTLAGAKGSVGNKPSPTASIDQVRIFDKSGTLVKTIIFGKGTTRSQINVSDLVSGVYVLEIKSGDELVRNKIIIQH